MNAESRDRLRVTVARSFDHVVMAMTLRGVTYLGEQRAPYNEEYDGNDLVAASHLIAWRGSEPVGVLRLRWFADFAKVERAAVLPTFRRHGVMRALMQEALRYSARRGYRQVLGHAQLNRVAYWRSHGFRVRPGRASFMFSDYEYVEIELADRNCEVLPGTREIREANVHRADILFAAHGDDFLWCHGWLAVDWLAVVG